MHWRSLRLLALVAFACSSQGEATPQANPDENDENPEPGPGPGPVPDPGQPARAERDVFQLGASRHLAHLVVDGDLVIDAGAPGFARYTRFGLPAPRWRLGRTAAGEPAAQAIPKSGEGSSLDVPLTAEQAAGARSLRLRVHARDAGGLSVGLDGKRVARVPLVPGWQELSIPAVGAGWHEGENRLLLTSSLGAGLHLGWLAVSSRDAAEPLAAPPLSRAGWNRALRALQVGDGDGLAWYVQLPDGAALVGEIAGDCTAQVTARDGDGHRAGGVLGGAATRVDLSALAGKVVRLEVTGKDCPRGGLLFGARITLPGAVPAPPDGAPPRYVIFWVMDALRADRIPTFQPGAVAETPNFDKLAETGAVFRQHYVGGNESQTSHASMFTGVYPAVHGLFTAGNQQKFTLPPKLPTVGRLMKDAGFTPLGVTGNGFVTEWGGFAKGFVEYRNMMRERGARNAAIPGATILEAMLEKLRPRAGGDAPVFVFMGTIDNHSPLTSRKPWIDRYSPDYDGPFQEGTDADILGIYAGRMGCHKVPQKREIDRMRAIYDSATSYIDARLGDLLAELEQLGIADQTMIVITADHGEELFEEKRCGHGASLRDSLARVPLLVHYPPRIAARIVEEGSEGVDVLPTILDAIGVEPPAGVQGRSLRRLAAGGDAAGWAQPSFASQYEYAFAVRLGRWKLRVKKKDVQVHDMVADPDERKDLSASRPFERRYLTDHLGLYLAFRTRWQKATWGVASSMTEDGAAAMEAR